MAALKLLSPSLILLATAGLVSMPSARAYLTARRTKAVAVVALLLALIAAGLQANTTARLVSLPLGAVSVSMIELRLGVLSLSWLQLLLFSSAAVILVSPVSSVPATLLLLGAAMPSMLAGSFPAVCLFWFVTEVALTLFRTPSLTSTHDSLASGGGLLPLLLGTAALVGALHASASDEALVLSLGSLRAVSWLLLIVAVGLRLRIWAPGGPSTNAEQEPTTEETLPVVALLVAGVTGFFTLNHLETTPRTGEAPQWFTLILLAIVVGTGVLAWAHRRTWPGVAVSSASALLASLLLPAALSFPPVAWVGPAAAHVLAVLTAYVILGRFALPSGLGRYLRAPAMVAAGLSLLPWPVLPYGRAITWSLDFLANFTPAGAILLCLIAGLPAAALLAGQKEGRDVEGQIAIDKATGWVALLLAIVGLGIAASFAAAQADTQALFPGERPSPGALALAVFSSFLGLALAAADRAEFISTFDTEMLRGPRRIVSRFLKAASANLTTGAELLFRFLEGETALTWAILIGAAVLILAAG